jgi:hypothetical protein
MFLCAAGLFGQSFHSETLHGRKAWVLGNNRIRVSALRGGGHIAEVRFQSGDKRRTVNPMRVPHYQTIEPYEYDPPKHDQLYGANPHRWLSAGYMGHLLCFPVFGPPSSEHEARNGLGNHGEAPIVEWKELGKAEVSGRAVKFRYGADLPKTQYRVERVITLPADEQVIYVEEWVENLAPYDRPINWVQHATFGAPFIAPAKSTLDMSATVGTQSGKSLKPEPTIQWPDAKLRPSQGPHTGSYYAVLMDQKRKLSYFTMYNPDYPVLIGYLFETAANPWIGDWQENQRTKAPPWNGKTIARGIEFGTTPFAEGLRRSVERGTMFGVPTYRWIGGRERLKTTFAIFLTEIPSAFAGIADVTAAAGSILIRERGTDRKLTLPAPTVAKLM